MKTGFLDFIALLLYFEGGLVDNPNDPGGLTNMGITIHTYKHHTGITDEVQARQGLKELTEEDFPENPIIIDDKGIITYIQN